MAKRKSDTQKLIAFAMTTTVEGLNAAIETLQAIRESKFPRVASGRKSRKPPQSRLNPLPPSDMETSTE